MEKAPIPEEMLIAAIEQADSAVRGGRGHADMRVFTVVPGL